MESSSNKMKAMIYDTSSPTGMSFKDSIDTPKQSGQQLLVEVHAVALNPIDYKLPQILGRFINKNFVSQDFSGVVIQAPQNSQFKVGDEVFGMASQAMAEKILVDPRYIALKPQNISHVEAASIPLAGQTSLQSLRDAGKVQPKSNVLILGASGGCGFLGVQIAKILGAEKVTGVCSQKNSDFVKSMGATDVHDYNSKDGPLPKIQEGQGYDCVYDTVSSPEDFNYRPSASKLLNPKTGQYVSINGSKLEWTRAMLSKALGRWVQGCNYQLVLMNKNKKDIELLAGWLKDQKLKPVIDHQYEFSAQGVKDAFERLQSRRSIGKVVIKLK